MMVEEINTKVDKFFSKTALAVSEGGDFSGYVVVRVYEPETDDDIALVLLVASPALMIHLRVTKIEEGDTEWIVTTSNKGRWALRVIPEDIRKDYRAGMKAEGYDI